MLESNNFSVTGDTRRSTMYGTRLTLNIRLVLSTRLLSHSGQQKFRLKACPGSNHRMADLRFQYDGEMCQTTSGHRHLRSWGFRQPKKKAARRLCKHLIKIDVECQWLCAAIDVCPPTEILERRVFQVGLMHGTWRSSRHRGCLDA